MPRRKDMNARELINHIEFLASSNQLKSKARFNVAEKQSTFDTLERRGASYDMLLKLSENMNKLKNWEVMVAMLQVKSSFNTKDQKLILELAKAFIRDVGVK